MIHNKLIKVKILKKKLTDQFQIFYSLIILNNKMKNFIIKNKLNNIGYHKFNKN